MQREQYSQREGQIRSSDHDPMAMFLYAIKAKETKRQYISKLQAFFDYLNLQGELNEQAAQFVDRSLKEAGWAMASLMRFINLQKERVSRKEITEATLRNYYKPIKLFCEMNDIEISWKKIAKGIPRGRNGI